MKLTLSSSALAVLLFTFSVVSAFAIPNTERDGVAGSVNLNELFKDLENKGAFNAGRRSGHDSLEEKRQNGSPGNNDPFGVQCEPGFPDCNSAGAIDTPNRFALLLVSGLVAVGGWLYDH